MIEVKNVTKKYGKFVAIDNISFTINEGEIVGLLGPNGAGKSTLLNMIAGVYPMDSGKILLDDIDISLMPQSKRARYIGRVFQDPMMGTAADMQIEENLALAKRRGAKRGLKWEVSDAERHEYRQLLRSLDLHLEDRLTQQVGLLSGGQRQALTLLMATLIKPSLLLLDEHTAALDPKTAAKVLKLTESLVKTHHLTTLMITHNMKDAIRLGNRLIMMHEGRIIFEADGTTKQDLTVEALLEKFESASGQQLSNDRMLLV